jgi:hypothetical protein
MVTNIGLPWISFILAPTARLVYLHTARNAEQLLIGYTNMGLLLSVQNLFYDYKKVSVLSVEKIYS